MAFLSTAPGVSFGLVEGRAVFLDVGRDRYATLPPDLLETFDGVLASNGAVQANDLDLSRLIATGLFATGSEPGLCEPTLRCPPTKGLESDERLPFRPLDLGEAWWLVTRAARRAAKSPFRTALAPPRLVGSEPSGPISPELEPLVRRFIRARTYVPLAPACLADSFALRDWLARRGVACRLVFAVRLDPFEAHCWLEAGDVVLNDAPERIATFVPVGTFP